MTDSVVPMKSIRKASIGQICQRERGIDSSGRRILCSKPAVFIIDGTPFCAEHAKERMAVLSVTT